MGGSEQERGSVEADQRLVTAWSQLEALSLPLAKADMPSVAELFENDATHTRCRLEEIADVLAKVGGVQSMSPYKLAMAWRDLAVVRRLDPRQAIPETQRFLDPDQYPGRWVTRGLERSPEARAHTLGGSIFGAKYATHDDLGPMLRPALPVLDSDTLADLASASRPRLQLLRSFIEECESEVRRPQHPAMTLDGEEYENGYLRTGHQVFGELPAAGIRHLPVGRAGEIGERTPATRIADDYMKHPTARPLSKSTAQLGYEFATLWNDALCLIAADRLWRAMPTLSRLESEFVHEARVELRIALGGWIAGVRPDSRRSPIVNRVLALSPPIAVEEADDADMIERRLTDLVEKSLAHTASVTRFGHRSDEELRGLAHLSDKTTDELLADLRQALTAFAAVEQQVDRSVDNWIVRTRTRVTTSTGHDNVDDVPKVPSCSVREGYSAVAARFSRLLLPFDVPGTPSAGSVANFATEVGVHLARARFAEVDGVVEQILEACESLRREDDCPGPRLDVMLDRIDRLTDELRDAMFEVAFSRDVQRFSIEDFSPWASMLTRSDAEPATGGSPPNVGRGIALQLANEWSSEIARFVGDSRTRADGGTGKLSALCNAVQGALASDRSAIEIAETIETAVREQLPEGLIARSAREGPNLEDLAYVAGALAVQCRREEPRQRIEHIVEVVTRRHGVRSPGLLEALSADPAATGELVLRSIQSAEPAVRSSDEVSTAPPLGRRSSRAPRKALPSLDITGDAGRSSKSENDSVAEPSPPSLLSPSIDDGERLGHQANGIDDHASMSRSSKTRHPGRSVPDTDEAPASSLDDSRGQMGF